MSYQEVQLIQSSLNELFRQTNKLNYEVEGHINEIYCGKEQHKDMKIIVPHIKDKIKTLNQQMDELQQLFQRYQYQSKAIGTYDQDNGIYWQNKIERLRASLIQQPLNLDKAVKNYNRAYQEDHSSNSTVERRKFNELQRGHDSLDRSQGYAHEIERHGQSIITNLYNQNQTLKKVKMRTFQMLNTIGMSESILKLIERRTKADMLIFLGLAILTLVLIYVLLYYIKPLLWGGA